jgi:hypothetical protein
MSPEMLRLSGGDPVGRRSETCITGTEGKGYSRRRAVIGWIFDARLTGAYAATVTAVNKVANANVMVKGSFGLMPKMND